MNNGTKKAAPDVATIENGNGQICIDSILIPENDYITAFEPSQGSIASILRHGKEKAITAQEISRRTGLNRRAVTIQIMEERRAGAPILSGGAGFWFAEDADEVRRCVAALHTRAGEIHKTARALSAILEGYHHV